MQLVLTATTPGSLLRYLHTEINYGQPPAAQDLWLAQRASQILIASPEYAGLKMKPQYIENGATDLVL